MRLHMPPATSQLDDLGDGALDPASLVAYQDGAIVSRQLIDKEAATVTIFAFDAGQRLSEHAAPHDALLLVLEGAATITVDGEPHAVTAGDLVPFPADVPHAVDATERFKMLLTMVR